MFPFNYTFSLFFSFFLGGGGGGEKGFGEQVKGAVTILDCEFLLNFLWTFLFS